MRVVCLTPELPYAPGGSGGSTRQFHLLARLVERGWDVECVAPVHADQREGAERLRAAGVTLHPAERPASRVAETLAALRASPGLIVAAAREPLLAWQVGVFWAALRPIAREVLDHRPPDVILVEHDWAAGWARDLPAQLPKALTLHNLSWAYYEARARAAGGPAGAALRVEARRFARFDRTRLGAYDLLVSMSDEDRAAVRSVSDVRCEAVPNGVDTDAMALGPPGDDPVLLFSGQLGYPPNAEALLWLMRDIWPRIRREVPSARLLVVGRDAPAEARRLADGSVELAGFVDDVRPSFERAQVVLAPMRSGGGTRLKVLDGLASGRPLVTTTMGAEGVALRDGVHAIVADGAGDFAAAAVRLLEDAALRARLGAAGRQLAEERYSWPALGDRLAGLLSEVAGSGPSSAAASR